MDKTKSAESRTNNRIPLDTVVRYSKDGLTWKEGRSKDISISGMFLMESEPAGQGQPLHLSFNLPNVRYQGEIEVDAEVVRTLSRQGHPYGVGLKFKTLRGRNYELLLEFVDRVLGMPLPDGIHGAGEADADGVYTLHLDRLVEEVVEREAEAKLERGASLERGHAPSRVIRAILWLAIIIGLGAAAYEFLSYVAVLTERLR
jgi:hypothetical protein